MRLVASTVLVLALTVALFTPSSIALNKYYKLTPAQKHFTAIIVQLKTFRSVNWSSPTSMWVQIPSSQSARATDLAEVIEDRARDALKQPFCVHIYVKKGQSLAASCVY